MKRLIKGFSLLEMLLVLAIASAILVMVINYIQQRSLQLQVDKTAQQMEQILTAGLSFYVAKGTWPIDMAELRTAGYLPANFGTSPFQTPYGLRTTPSNLYVFNIITGRDAPSSYANALMIAGKLPLAFTSDAGGGSVPPPSVCTTTNCRVYASVNIPGQNLNNARAVNFAGVYHHGACIPVPQCPVDPTGNTMVPQVFVVPIQVSGLYNPNDNQTVYPISSFTAYAVGGPGQGSDPAYCKNEDRTFLGIGGPGQTCLKQSWGNGFTNGANAVDYWRACLDITTSKGNVNQNRTGSSSDVWGQNVTLAAFTRCEAKGEPGGSNFSLFGN